VLTYDWLQLPYTTRHRTVLIIFPLILRHSEILTVDTAKFIGNVVATALVMAVTYEPRSKARTTVSTLKLVTLTFCQRTYNRLHILLQLYACYTVGFWYFLSCAFSPCTSVFIFLFYQNILTINAQQTAPSLLYCKKLESAPSLLYSKKTGIYNCLRKNFKIAKYCSQKTSVIVYKYRREK